MKKLMIIAAAMFCMTGAMAQESNVTAPIEKKQVKKMPRKHMDPVAKMARELDLTPEQMTKVRELNAKYPELARGKGRTARTQRTAYVSTRCRMATRNLTWQSARNCARSMTRN